MLNTDIYFYKKIKQLFKGIFENTVTYDIYGTQIVTIKINGEYYRFYFFNDENYFQFYASNIENQVLKDYSKYMLSIISLKNKLEKNELVKEDS